MLELRQSDNQLKELIRMGYEDGKGQPTKRAEGVSLILMFDHF
jgi:hypothetical protein